MANSGLSGLFRRVQGNPPGKDDNATQAREMNALRAKAGKLIRQGTSGIGS